ncbi:EutN/CcmL family microcompartment protein, partial [Mycobacterium tuberculosis]|nr:EutN/CcmL family microcompartment protein [Mycobacterium tuberculosis]
SKLLVVARLSERLIPTGPTEIAVDSVGAGNGEVVIVTCGSSARGAVAQSGSVVDAAIVGIVDTVEIAAAEAAGLEIVDLRTADLRIEIHDVAAVVYLLRKVVWWVPGFTVEG